MTAEAMVPTLIGVLGGGRMGSGIAQVFAALGSDVVVAESGQTAAHTARERVAGGLRRAAEKGKHRAGQQHEFAVDR